LDSSGSLATLDAPPSRKNQRSKVCTQKKQPVILQSKKAGLSFRTQQKSNPVVPQVKKANQNLNHRVSLSTP
jgi:hypothetical protein